MFDTHYYGGVKKYQWVTLPLALHGVVAKKDGTVVNISIGDKENDPVFGVSDLLIHLAGDQLEKKASKVIEGENLDVLIGSIPADVEEKDKVKETVKANVLNILLKEYDIEEEDFLSAEIEVVPAGAARDYGFDRSMVMGYGHDDRVCAYPSFRAVMGHGSEIVVGAAVTATLGTAAAPGVVVIAISGAVVAGFNTGVKALTGETATEWASDMILDTGENIIDSVGNAIAALTH